MMRVVRGLIIALLTALAGCVLAVPVGDYLTKLVHVPEMEGQRGMTVFFLCVPLGIMAGLVVGVIASIVVRRQGPAGFLIALGWSLLIVCGIAGLLGGVPYLLSDKPPTIDGKRLELQFELRAPATLKIPEQPDGYSIRVILYNDNRQSGFAFIDWNGITKSAEYVSIPGDLSLLTHSKSRSLLASIGNEPGGSQFIELKNLSPAPRKQDEAWSDWIFATAYTDLSLIPDPERFAIRYRVHPIER